MDTLISIEIGSTILQILFIVFLIEQNRTCWIFGFFASLSGAYLMFQQNYFSETILYVFYALMAIYGWFIWSRPQKFKIIKNSSIQNIVLIAIGIASTGVLGYVMKTKTEADLPFYDALSTCFGIIATFLEAHKVLAGWLYWIAINAYSIWLYLYKDLYWYSGLMVVFTVLSVKGYLDWSKKMKENGTQMA